MLRQLVCGAAGRLQKLDLAGSNVASLGFLAEATSLTYLDLAGMGYAGMKQLAKQGAGASLRAVFCMRGMQAHLGLCVCSLS